MLLQVIRKDDKNMKKSYYKWVVDRETYSADVFPPYCNGPAYFFSYSLLPEVVSRCPHHCTGFLQGEHKKNDSSCFWLWEDVFFGSCFNTFQPRPYTNFSWQERFFWSGVPKMSSMPVGQPWASFHPVKKPKLLLRIHKHYHRIPESRLRKLTKEIEKMNTLNLPKVVPPFYETPKRKL